MGTFYPEVNLLILSADEMLQILRITFGPQLESAGFTESGTRMWTRSVKTHITEVFQIQPVKGLSYSPRWGLSLDFVPRISGSSIKWHRTPKSAVIDLKYDPLDYERIPFCTSRIDGCSAEQTSQRLADGSISSALSWFDKVRSEEDLLTAFEEARSLKAIRFAFYNYRPHAIAYAFVLSRAGRLNEAKVELHKYLEHFPFLTDKTVERLNQLLTETYREKQT
jgi:hypothetical protein